MFAPDSLHELRKHGVSYRPASRVQAQEMCKDNTTMTDTYLAISLDVPTVSQVFSQAPIDPF